MIHDVDFQKLSPDHKEWDLDLNDATDPYTCSEEFEEATIEKILPQVASVVLPIKCKWFDQGNFSAGVIRNLPYSMPIDATPTCLHDVNKDRNSYTSEKILYSVGRCFGEVFAFKEEYSGAKIKNIFPRKDVSTYDNNNYGAHLLNLHTEVAWANFRPDYIVLLCINNANDGGIPTDIISIDTLRQKMSTDDLDRLQHPEFRIGIPEMFRSSVNETYHWTQPIPLVEKTGMDLRIRANMSFVRSFKTRYASTLSRLQQICEKYSTPITLKTGDVLVINNNKALHGRRAFNAKIDGSDRWMQQVYISGQMENYRGELSGTRNILSVSSA